MHSPLSIIILLFFSSHFIASVGHKSFVHSLHSVHSLESTFTFFIDNFEVNFNMPASGHKYLQNNLSLNDVNKKIKNAMLILISEPLNANMTLKGS